MKHVFLLLLTLGSHFAQAQPFTLVGFDVDTAHQEWSALNGDFNNFVISTVDQPQANNQPLGMPLGNIRLLFYTLSSGTNPFPQLDTILLFKGKARVSHIAPLGNGDYMLCGGFADTLVLGQDSLFNPEAFSFDPFIFRVNATGQVLWYWSIHRPQNNYLHKIRGPFSQGSKILAVGLADDVTGWLVALNPQTGSLLWEEVATGSRTISDAHLVETAIDTSLLVTGTCNGDAQLFGLNVPPSQPVTGYQTFLYRRSLPQLTGSFLKVASHFTFDFEPEIAAKSPFYPEFSWITPYSSDSVGISFVQKLAQFSFNQSQLNYTETTSSSLAHNGIFASLAGTQYSKYVAFGNPNAPMNQLNLREIYNNNSTSISLGFNNPYPSLGFMANSQLWLATRAVSQLQYTSDFGPSGTLQFPNIANQSPRWVLLTRDEYVSVDKHQLQLQFDVFPNPIQDLQFKLSLAENADLPAHWAIRDLQGRQIISDQLTAIQSELRLPALSSGVYLLEVKSGTKTGFQKIVVP